MDFRTLELNLAQLSRCLDKSKINKYADKRKKSYQETLLSVFEKLKQEDFSKMSSTQLANKKQIIDFIFTSIQYLDNSTLTITPFEIVYCLENVLNEWIPNNKFIIVTSLSNHLTSYSFQGYLAFHEPIYKLIENDYGETFAYRLVQITLPKYYVHDYLANVVLYHELGHFIDTHSRISLSIAFDMVSAGKLPNPRTNRQSFERQLSYYMEYFADIFAAQYIGEASNYFLNYIAYKNPDSDSHPATDTRLQKVNYFLNGNNDQEIDDLKRYTSLRMGGRQLVIRHNNLPLDDFYNLLPYEITNDIDLHSVFLAGWEVWQEPNNKLKNQFGNDTAYKIINNLLEKGISNYIVTKSWNT